MPMSDDELQAKVSGGMTDEALMQKVSPKTEQPSTLGDVVKAIPRGLAKGAVSTAGMIGDMREGAIDLTGKAAEVLGAKPKSVESAKKTIKEMAKFSPLGAGPTSEDIKKLVVRPTIGEFDKAKTKPGKFAESISEFVPASLLGGGSWLTRLIGAIGGGTGAELAGSAFEGKKAEPWARALGGIAGGLTPTAVTRAITPSRITPERQAMVQTLQQEGVNPTAGQQTGSKALRYAENHLGDLPGGAQTGTRETERVGREFTSAALRRVGENADRATPEVVDRAFRRIGREFDTLEAAYNPAIDRTLLNRINRIENDYNAVVAPSSRVPIVNNTVEDLLGRFVTQGHLTGAQYKDLSSRLEKARRNSTDPALKETLGDMRNAVHDMMERHIKQANPADLGAWQEARRQYRNMLVIERAATGAGEEAAQGILSPARLRQALVSQSKRDYGRGRGDFADLVRAGEGLLKPLPQSGTAPRAFSHSVPIGLATGAGLAATGNLPGAVAAAGGPFVPGLMGRGINAPAVQQYLTNQLLPGQYGPTTLDAIVRGAAATPK